MAEWQHLSPGRSVAVGGACRRPDRPDPGGPPPRSNLQRRTGSRRGGLGLRKRHSAALEGVQHRHARRLRDTRTAWRAGISGYAQWPVRQATRACRRARGSWPFRTRPRSCLCARSR